jgi:NHL repeat
MRFPRHFSRCADPFGEPPIRNTVTRRGVGRIVRAIARVRAPALRAEVPKPPSDLVFPGKATVLAGGDVLVSDSGHHRLAVLAADLQTVPPDDVLVSGTGTDPGLERTLLVRGPGTVRVDAVAAAYDGKSDEVGIFAACHRYRREWDVEVAVVPGGATAVELELAPGR